MLSCSFLIVIFILKLGRPRVWLAQRLSKTFFMSSGRASHSSVLWISLHIFMIESANLRAVAFAVLHVSCIKALTRDRRTPPSTVVHQHHDLSISRLLKLFQHQLGLEQTFFQYDQPPYQLCHPLEIPWCLNDKFLLHY